MVDSLLALNVSVKKVFAPEHGFRGKADAGEVVKDGIDTKTGLPIISLYGKNKKPYPKQIEDLDIVIFDIQDVGARFYTYISTLHYVMKACAEQNIPVLILDRPNPNGHYIDGPVLEIEHQSFVGTHPIPVVHGMTIGEYAQMINGEKWLTNGIQCKLTIIKVDNYTHNSNYSLPIKPSPNLPNDKAINLYPSLCFFEGTNVSIGRGTDKQFQIAGSPFNKGGKFKFTPEPKPGASRPKHKGEECNGVDLSQFGAKHMQSVQSLYLNWIVEFYQNSKDKKNFFLKNGFFTLLVGNTNVRKMIEEGKSAAEISATWAKEVEEFKQIRKKYLLYKDFE